MKGAKKGDQLIISQSKINCNICMPVSLPSTQCDKVLLVTHLLDLNVLWKNLYPISSLLFLVFFFLDHKTIFLKGCFFELKTPFFLFISLFEFSRLILTFKFLILTFIVCSNKMFSIVYIFIIVGRYNLFSRIYQPRHFIQNLNLKRPYKLDFKEDKIN